MDERSESTKSRSWLKDTLTELCLALFNANEFTYIDWTAMNPLHHIPLFSRSMARRIDRPTAALLKDLKARGLLDQTLVIWGGEFGRTPVSDGRYEGKPPGRDHNPYGFTTWLAGGGIRGGQVVDATDEFGFRAVEDRVHVNDLHATILKLLGLDHEKLTFLFQGRNQRLTDVGGENEFAERLLS